MNLSNAVSVVVYEAWRQLDYAGALIRHNPRRRAILEASSLRCSLQERHMAFIEDIVTQLRRLETALNEALLRLQQAQDSEALHDLRVCLRRIRSLLRPLRGCPVQRGSIGPPPS